MIIIIKKKTFSTYVVLEIWADAAPPLMRTWQGTMSALQLEEMEHMSQALWMSGSSAESPPRFVDVSLARCPLLVW